MSLHVYYLILSPPLKAKDKDGEEAEDSDSSSSSSSLPSLEEEEEEAGGKKPKREEETKKKSAPKKKRETSEQKGKGGKVNKETTNFTTILCSFIFTRLCLYIVSYIIPHFIL